MRQVINYNNKNVILPNTNYFYFMSDAAGSTIQITQIGTYLVAPDFEYSYDGFNWNTYTMESTITLSNIGDKLYIRGNNISLGGGDNGRKQFILSGSLKVGGDLRSLLNKTDFQSIQNLQPNAYYNIMRDCTAITDARDLKITAKNVGSGALCNTFKNCTNLVYGPVIIDVENFSGKDNCSQMFQGCTSLVESPILKGSILINGTFYAMFDGCTSLNKVTTYCTDASATNCTYYWLRNVAATGDFYNLGNATFSSDTSGIPSGWTEHTSL